MTHISLKMEVKCPRGSHGSSKLCQNFDMCLKPTGMLEKACLIPQRYQRINYEKSNVT